MDNRMEGFEEMEETLLRLSRGLTPEERRAGAVKAGKRFKEVVKPTVPFRMHKKSDKSPHLRDSIAVHSTKDGEAQVGFSRDSKKGYIGRFLNDGWDIRRKDGTYRHVNGLHYWEAAKVASEEDLVKILEMNALSALDKKVVRHD